MRDITAALLAIVFGLCSLIALLSVERSQDGTSSPLVSNQERISELEVSQKENNLSGFEFPGEARLLAELKESATTKNRKRNPVP